MTRPRLQTHQGVGLLTSLCVVHTLGNLGRFVSTLKVAAYVAFDPMEDLSVGKSVRFVSGCCPCGVTETMK